MKHIATAVSLGWVILGSSLAVSYSPSECTRGISGVPCGDKVERLCEAAKQTDTQARETLLLRLLAEGLESPDRQTRRETFRYLTGVDRYLDIRPLQRNLEVYDTLSRTHEGRGEFEQVSFQRSDRQTRVEGYRDAIVSGQATLGTVAVLPRAVAMREACFEGMSELRAVIERHYPELGPEDQRRTGPLDELMANLELRGGATSPEEAHSLAVARLSEMPTPLLWSRIESSYGWRRAVEDAARFACEDPNGDSCTLVKGVIDRQAAKFQSWYAGHATSSNGSVGPAQATEKERATSLREFFERLPSRPN